MHAHLAPRSCCMPPQCCAREPFRIPAMIHARMALAASARHPVHEAGGQGRMLRMPCEAGCAMWSHCSSRRD